MQSTGQHRHQWLAPAAEAPQPCAPPPFATEVYGFSSERKMASVLERRNGKLRLYNKGAAEMVLTRCTAMINSAGESVPMTEVGGGLGAGRLRAGNAG